MSILNKANLEELKRYFIWFYFSKTDFSLQLSVHDTVEEYEKALEGIKKDHVFVRSIYGTELEAWN